MKDTLFCVGSVLVSLLLAAISLRYVTHTWLLAFVYSFQVHFALVALVGALLLLLLKRHWFAYVLLAGALFLLGHGLFMLKAFEAAPATAATQPAFRLISFNIENFNFKNGRPIADAVIASGADVVNILEAEPLIPEIARLTQAYPYRIGCGVETDGCDTLVLSKRPFVETSVSSIGDLWPNRVVTSVIDVNGTRITFVSVHLAKPYFDDFQVNELVDLRGVIAAIKGPLVLAGDFNSAIIDPDIQRFVATAGLNTVFPEPATWPIKAGPLGIAIDHVLARPPLRLTSVKRMEDSIGSNHFGLVAEVGIDR
jgi:endonuclease/exonuclease/phosphatase (EEP) superfamily protein YafD